MAASTRKLRNGTETRPGQDLHHVPQEGLGKGA
jgi:hypothetical protein